MSKEEEAKPATVPPCIVCRNKPIWIEAMGRYMCKHTKCALWGVPIPASVWLAIGFNDAEVAHLQRQLSEAKRELEEAGEPMECGHFAANIQPSDENVDFCIVCAEIAEMKKEIGEAVAESTPATSALSAMDEAIDIAREMDGLDWEQESWGVIAAPIAAVITRERAAQEHLRSELKWAKVLMVFWIISAGKITLAEPCGCGVCEECREGSPNPRAGKAGNE
jgi:hypothetical protein